MPIEKYIPKKDRCEFCGREATLLCDMPRKIVSHARGSGFNITVLTCDKKICVKCATRVNGYDFCPECVQKIREARKGAEE